MDEAMMMITADNRDDFAVLRSNNWLAWLTVTSSRGERGGRAPHSSLSTKTKTLLKPPKIHSTTWTNTFNELDILQFKPILAMLGFWEHLAMHSLPEQSWAKN